jgi:ElaB/YqjD/DUF883 family membrane-anchored ribosome-binding protein
MSDKTSVGGSDEGIYGAAKEAMGSAAEQVRAAGPGTYEAGVKAARYVGETASEHPLILGTLVAAFLGGLLSVAVGRDHHRRDWREQARDWRDRGVEIGKHHIRSVAPDVSKATDDAGKYVSQTVRENPMSGLLVAAAVGGVLGYLLPRRPS